MNKLTESMIKTAERGLEIGLTITSAYTLSFLATKKTCCQTDDDQIMRVVRGITGGIIGGVVGNMSAGYITKAIENRKESDDNE